MYPNADLKIFLYVCVHIKIIPRKFRIPESYAFSSYTHTQTVEYVKK